jgi:hypothetical protein
MKNTETRIAMVLLFWFAFMADVLTPSYGVPGVKSGDWIRYGVQESFSSGERWQKVEYLNATSTSVTVRITDYMPNGMETAETRTIDLASRDDYPSALFSVRVCIIPSDLDAGDLVYLGQFGNETIVGETTIRVAGADRRVVYSNFSQVGSQYTFYWDKQTGVLTQGLMTSGLGYKSVWVTETNMWSGGYDWWLWVIVIVVVVCGLIVSRKKIQGMQHGKEQEKPGN